jgi:hypothetical protein
MTEVACRDCGQLGSEDPDDPAPALCPRCYEKRLAKITPILEAKCETFEGNDITPLIQWLAEALEVIGGEKREFAHQHANQLAHEVVLASNQQSN